MQHKSCKRCPCLHHTLHIYVCGQGQHSEVCACLAKTSPGFEQGDIVLQGRLPPRWKALVTRDNSGAPSEQGQVWACPYRWGSTLIAYRKDALLRCVSSNLLLICLLGPCHAVSSFVIGMPSPFGRGAAMFGVSRCLLPQQCSGGSLDRGIVSDETACVKHLPMQYAMGHVNLGIE